MIKRPPTRTLVEPSKRLCLRKGAKRDQAHCEGRPQPGMHLPTAGSYAAAVRSIESPVCSTFT